MISNVLDQFLNESTSYSNIEVPEASNEGFEHEFGGVSRINTLAESALDEFTAMEIANEVKCCRMLAEGADYSEILVLQEGVITNVIEGTKKVLQKLWARMKSICQSVKLQFEKVFSTKSFIRDAEKILKNMTDFSGLELEGYNFTQDKVDPKAMATKMISYVKGVSSQAQGIVKSVKVTDKTSMEETKKQIDSKAKPILEKISEGGKRNDNLCQTGIGCKAEDVNKTIFKALRSGKDSEEKVTWSKDNCLNALKNFTSLQNDVNSIGSDVDTMFKEAISAMDDIKKTGESASDGMKDNQKEVSKAAMSLVDKCAKALTYSMTVCNTVTGMKLQALKDEASQSKSFISKAISQGKKNVRNVSESTGIEGSMLDTILNNY